MQRCVMDQFHLRPNAVVEPLVNHRCACSRYEQNHSMATSGKSSSWETQWKSNPRWQQMTRPYSRNDVEQLRGSVQIERTLARMGGRRPNTSCGPRIADAGSWSAVREPS
jgi:hypothetical protein